MHKALASCGLALCQLEPGTPVETRLTVETGTLRGDGDPRLRCRAHSGSPRRRPFSLLAYSVCEACSGAQGTLTHLLPPTDTRTPPLLCSWRCWP